jgi:hypothetical protein
MPREEVLNLLQKYVIPYRVPKGKGFRLKDFDPGDTGGRRRLFLRDASGLEASGLPISRRPIAALDQGKEPGPSGLQRVMDQF